MNLAFHDEQFANAIAVQTRPLNKQFLPALKLDLVDATPNEAITTLLTSGRTRAFFMNAHCCNVRRKNPAYARAVEAADHLLPDGIGIELAAKFTKQELKANLNGTDLVPELLVQAAQLGKSVFLFGAKPGTAEKAARKLAKKIPNLIIAGTRNGYDGAKSASAAIEDINASGADIVLVALGVPMQELWLDRHADDLNADLTLAVGALFDFWAGNVKRAPKIVRRGKLEWAWRLAKEPRRLASRYLVGNATFLISAAAGTLNNKREIRAGLTASPMVLDHTG